MNIVICGLSLSSAWGNGHATTYRGLIRGLDDLGHQVVFLERDVPWYANHRDLPDPEFCTLRLYRSLQELKDVYTPTVRAADAVIVGSYVPEGVDVGRWAAQAASGPVAFYDIDTPVTLGKLARGDYEYLRPEQIAEYDLYLSFTGGPLLERLKTQYHSPMARPLYCSADPEKYFPNPRPSEWCMGYLGTYSPDRQPVLERLLIEPARRRPDLKFVVAGPQYPDRIDWPGNVHRIDHLPPTEHCRFYNSQAATLNVTREEMVAVGYCPSVRLFEAAACGTAIISDYWDGLETIFDIGTEILVARSTEEALQHLSGKSVEQLDCIGQAARRRFARQHSSLHRARELEQHLLDAAELAAARRGSYRPAKTRTTSEEPR
ncbi:MAG: glycosyltransferase [Phycisphaerae bacterium]